ncbi:hypothetical protein F444_13342 [Phytophthora nicotianae P1976]|uniref:Uncharacterized protein n=1 Tax=Phytophthora nicotianae P1976 TaxID=1317066 RepID=A0A080ZU43_PHYNI|nr:hypothetical protein F444_13342 [Phytophthora nicotianae P1976]
MMNHWDGFICWCCGASWHFLSQLTTFFRNSSHLRQNFIKLRLQVYDLILGSLNLVLEPEKQSFDVMQLTVQYVARLLLSQEKTFALRSTPERYKRIWVQVV